MKKVEKHGEIFDGRKSGYRSNSIRKKHFLIYPWETSVLSPEDELFAEPLEPLTNGDYEFLGLYDIVTTPSPPKNYSAWHSTMPSGSSDRLNDDLLDAILTSASVLIDRAIE
jgi:hypothetical protein